MKHHTRSLWISALGVAALIGSAQAGVVLLDNFSDPDTTTLAAHIPDIPAAGAWTGNTSSPIVGDAIKLAANGNRASIDFTALGAGETLTLTFETLAGTGFGQTGGQGFELALRLADGTNVFAIGDHRADYRTSQGNSWGAPTTGWMVGDSVDSAYGTWGEHWQTSGGDQTQTVAGAFTYTYDTGAWDLVLTDTSDSSLIWSTNGTNPTLNGSNPQTTGDTTYAPANQALAQFSMNRENARAANLDWVQVEISPVPEPSAVALMLGACSLLAGCRRR